MNNVSYKDTLLEEECEESLVDLVKSFLDYTDALLSQGVISEQLYHELRREKEEFLENTKIISKR